MSWLNSFFKTAHGNPLIKHKKPHKKTTKNETAEFLRLGLGELHGEFQGRLKISLVSRGGSGGRGRAAG